MLRNKEPELAEKIDSSFGCFDLGFYRVNFVFGSRHLIRVPQAPYSGSRGQKFLHGTKTTAFVSS